MSIYFLIVFFIVVIIWDSIWKGLALWKSARNNHLNWFVSILVFNTVGILPIIYLKYYQRRKKWGNKR